MAFRAPWVCLVIAGLAFASTATAGATDGAWLPQWQGAPYPVAVVFDPHERRLVAFGSAYGSPAANSVWVLSLDAPTVWKSVPSVGPGPSQRLRRASFTFDPVRGRYLFCGGIDRYGVGGSTRTFGGCWALRVDTTAVWTRLPDIPARHGHSAAYDSLGDRLIIYGGSFNEYYEGRSWNYFMYSDAMSFSGASNEWSAMTPTGAAPGPRVFHTVAFDATHRRMWLFGGTYYNTPDAMGTGPAYNDLRALDLTGAPNWVNCPPTGAWPPGEFYGHLTLDAADSLLTLLPYRSNGPSTERWRRATVDSAGWAPVITNGAWSTDLNFGDPAQAQTLLLDWSKLSLSTLADSAGATIQSEGIPVIESAPIRVSRRNRSALAYNPTSGSTYLFGGDANIFEFCFSPHLSRSRDEEYNDLWRIPSDPLASAVYVPVTSPPLGRSGHAMIVDRRQRLIVFGGRYSDLQSCVASSSEFFLGDTKTVDLTAPTAWATLAATGTPPSARSPDAAVYDNLRDRMMVLGGSAADDVWGLELSPSASWSLLQCLNTPSGTLKYRASVLDSVGDRLLVHGLTGDQSLWALSLSTNEWSVLLTEGTPPPVVSAATRAVFDPMRRRMLIYDGSSATQPVYELMLEDSLLWRRVNLTSGTAPSARLNAAVAYESSTDRLIIVGGYDPSTYSELGDTHVLAQEYVTATLASVVSATAAHGAADIYWQLGEELPGLRVQMSEGRDRDWVDVGLPSLEGRDLLSFHATGLKPGLERGFRLAWNGAGVTRSAGEVWVTSPRQRLGLAMASISPIGRTPECEVTLDELGAARLDVLDVSGRVMGRTLHLEPSTDAVRVQLQQVTDSAAGVYWVRVRQNTETVTRRFIRMR